MDSLELPQMMWNYHMDSLEELPCDPIVSANVVYNKIAEAVH